MSRFQNWRTALWALLVAFGLAILLGLTTTPAQAVTSGYSGGWAGLVSPGGGYVQITADATVPRWNASCGSDANVAVFVGLGGRSSLPFVQNGFSVTAGGIGVWSEVFDRSGHGPVTVVKLAVRSGDRVRLGLAFSAHGTVLTFYWSNLTLHRTVTQRVTNAARYYNGSTADYIVERSNYPHAGSPLANYDRVSFGNAKAARYGQWVPAYNAHTEVISTLGRRGNVISRVSGASGQAFNTVWSGCQ